MVTVLNTRSVTDAVLTRIQTAVTCGDADTPTHDQLSDGRPSAPYAVLYPLPDLDGGGALSDGHQWAMRHFQVTVVGGTRQSCEEGQMDVREVLMGWSPSVAGLSCGKVELDDPTGVDRDDDATPPVFFTTDRFRLFVS